MLLKDFGDIKKLFTKLDNVWIDNNAFRLHYKGTFLVFLISSLLVTFNQYFGDPIDCIVDDASLEKVMDTYCWIKSTFSVPSRWPNHRTDEFAYPGIRPQHGEYGYSRYSGFNERNEQPEQREHKYYQWVCFVLLLQAIMTYVPRYLWKIMEGRRMQALVGKLCREPMLSPTEKEEEIERIVKYFKKQRGKRDLSYSRKFFFLEFLNLVNIVFQYFFINWFLNYEFTDYGLFEILRLTGLEPEHRPDPMSKVFPKVTKCSFSKFGPSGTIQTHDGLCVLPLNIINEKVYIFLGAWLIIAGTISVLYMVKRGFTLLFNPLRCWTISSKGTKVTKSQVVEAILLHEHPGYNEQLSDWFLLDLICKNLHPSVVDRLIEKLNSNEVNEPDERRKNIFTKYNDSGISSIAPTAPPFSSNPYEAKDYQNLDYDEMSLLNSNHGMKKSYAETLKV